MLIVVLLLSTCYLTFVVLVAVHSYMSEVIKTLACIERRRKLCLERFQAYYDAVGSSFGLVSPGLASWLLDVTDSRIRFLIERGRLKTRILAGQRLILFSSVEDYLLARTDFLQRRFHF